MSRSSSAASATAAPPHPNLQLYFSTAPRRRGSNNPTYSSSSSPTNNSLISHSSSSSFRSVDEYTSTPPATSRRSTGVKQVGIPFSWEDLPGIPKTQSQLLLKSKPSSNSHLPLPPAGPKLDGRRNAGRSGGRRDPFMAALLQCSNDGAGRDSKEAGKKVGRSVSERFRLTPISIQQLSCKRACGVSDSLVFLPRPRRISYDLLHKASG